MKKLILPLFILAIIGGIIGYKMYNKPHNDMSRAKVDIKIEASELLSEYEGDETAANTKYLDKVVGVSGKVMEVSKDKEGKTSIVLDAGGMLGGVICKLDPLSEHKRETFKTGETVAFKGLCKGKLMDVILERCVEL